MCKIDEEPCSHNKSFAHSACLRFPVNAPGSNMDNIFDILVFNIFAFLYFYELKACYFPVCTIATKMVNENKKKKEPNKNKEYKRGGIEVKEMR